MSDCPWICPDKSARVYRSFWATPSSDAYSPSRSRKAKSAKSLLTEAFSHNITALAYLPGQCFGDRVFDPGLVRIQEDRLGQFRHTTAHKRFGKSRVFRQLLEV